MRLNDFQIAPNFNMREFQCPCCHCVMVHRKLVAALQSLRDLLNRPLIITSGYRCAPHNAAVGGVKNSLHRHGLAADVAVASGEQPLFCDGARGVGFTKALAYPERGFVHLEVCQ